MVRAARLKIRGSVKDPVALDDETMGRTMTFEVREEMNMW
jgi:hypothetical protein